MERLLIKGLTKSYGNGVKALDNVSLAIPNGLFGLLGPNGAGKSSLMHTLATLQQPDSGQILFDGNDILKTHKPCEGSWAIYRRTLAYTQKYRQ
jgi:ABC-type multidrug transport system ATPase subunit